MFQFRSLVYTLPAPRAATIKPTQVKSRKDQGLNSWCLNVPADLSETGKRQRLFFESKKEATTASEQIQTRKDNFGISLSSLTPARLAEAAEAYSILDGVNVSLVSVARSYMESYKQRTASPVSGARVEAAEGFAEAPKPKKKAEKVKSATTGEDKP